MHNNQYQHLLLQKTCIRTILAQPSSSKPVPGKLRVNLDINVKALKPGAENPLIAKKKRESDRRISKDATTLAKLNQVIIPKKRRKAKRNAHKSLILADSSPEPLDQIEEEKSKPPPPPNRMSFANQNQSRKVPPTPPPPLPPYPASDNTKANTRKRDVSLVPSKPTPGGPGEPSPQPPSDNEGTPTPPPPPPPDERRNSNSNFVDIKKAPPPPAPPVLRSIDKEPRDTAESTTFTVSGQKITIIGHARTGKTSLKNALFGKEFKDMTFPTVKAPLQPTIVVKPLSIAEHPEDEDNAPDLDEHDEVNVQYEIWDTPGQKVLEYIPPLYITGAFCVFVVFDITDKFSFERAMYWVEYLEENAKGYENVVLIGNKHDLQDTNRGVESEEVQVYADQHGIFFIEISVKTKHNFDVLLNWLNQKTQEKLHQQIQNEQYVEHDAEHKMEDDAKEQNKKPARSRKSLLKQHHRNNQTFIIKDLEEDQANVAQKRSNCCLW